MMMMMMMMVVDKININLIIITINTTLRCCLRQLESCFRWFCYNWPARAYSSPVVATYTPPASYDTSLATRCIRMMILPLCGSTIAPITSLGLFTTAA